MLKDNICPKQFGTITKIYPDGREETVHFWADDIVTTRGKNRAASHLANSNPGKTWFTHIALGENDDAESTEDVALGDETYRVALDSVFASGETVFGRVVIQADSVDSGTVTIKELGLLDAGSGGNLICRQVPNTALSASGTEKWDILWGLIVN